MSAQLVLISAALLVAIAIFFATAFVLTAHKAAPLGDRAQQVSSQLMAGLERTSAARMAPAVTSRLAGWIQKAGTDQLTPERIMARAIVYAWIGTIWGAFMWLAQFPWVLCFAAPLLGGALPFFQLNDRVKNRQNAILRDLSYHLDLLTLSVEAGLDFGAALGRIVEKGKAGPLRDEFALMLSQIRVGTPRSQALRALGERIRLPQISSFTSSLIQADKLGVSLGKVLRTQSETVRIERSQRAEKRANEAPVKILIPLVLFIFPTIWIILAAPLIFSWMF